MLWHWNKTCSCGKYLAVKMPEHPRAWSNGYVHEHVLVLENSLGRLLVEDEVTHHKDGNGKNNSRGNLEVMLLSEHSRKHRLGSGEGPVECICAECGKVFYRDFRHRVEIMGYLNTFCSSSCNGKYQRRLQLERNPPVLIHGYRGYKKGCRCTICKAGSAAHMRDYRESKK